MTSRQPDCPLHLLGGLDGLGPLLLGSLDYSRISLCVLTSCICLETEGPKVFDELKLWVNHQSRGLRKDGGA